MAGGLRWTSEQLAEWEEKQRNRPVAGTSSRFSIDPILASNAVPAPIESDPGPEHDLQTRIEIWCSDHALPFFHDRSRGKNESGFVDLVIAFPHGLTVWAELKSKHGRLSDDQKRWRSALLFLGHRWVEIRSFRQFLRIAISLSERD